VQPPAPNPEPPTNAPPSGLSGPASGITPKKSDASDAIDLTRAPVFAAAPRGVLGIGAKFALVALALSLISSALSAWLGYRSEWAAHLQGVDAKLRSVAAAVPLFVPDDYQRRAMAGAVSQAEYDLAAARLTSFAHQAGVYYVYTDVWKDGRMLETATSLSDQELAENKKGFPLRPYEKPPAALVKLIQGTPPSNAAAPFVEYRDEFGSFRSTFVRHETPDGPYTVGVDVALDELRADARASMLNAAAGGALVGLAVAAVGLWFGRRIASPIRRLIKVVRVFGDGDFSNDAPAQAELASMARRHRDEIGEFANAFLQMDLDLKRRIDDLTTMAREKERLATQLDIARRIQADLLPKDPPQIVGWDIAGWSRPADETGGDFYDWLITPHGRIIIVIADAAGHGLGPAMMAAACRAYSRATLSEDGPLQPQMARLNALLCADQSEGKFITFLACVLDPADAVVRLHSAGHGPILVYRAATNSVEGFETHGLALGIFADFEFDPHTEFHLDPGDAVLLVSDGFFEWMNRRNEQFGVDRLRQSLIDARNEPAAGIIANVRRNVARFTEGLPQPDDMTAVVVKRGA
jgi:serine phosphatase RsbU (regulator of sigma subunit)/HAMP domain-containing protein